ncbi:MAG: HAD-IC family P-type ATPase [Clostridia bacterium]|nr:HAD-IC family P-type ATPase [Clostridia bacterium]
MKIKNLSKNIKKKFSKTDDVVSIERYNPSPALGLTDEQVASRKEIGETNIVTEKNSKSVLSIFVDNIFTFFNFLGLIVFIALLYAKAELFNFVFVLVYCANMIIGIVQEMRAKVCIDKLSLMSEKSSEVMRNGTVYDIPSSEIVLDDVVILSIGCQVPTDCIILEGSVEVNESLLTGESHAIKKGQKDNLFAGSFITGGRCVVQAMKVGKNNYISRLSSKAKKYKKPHSELIYSLKVILKILGFAIIPLGVLYFIKSAIWQGAPINESIIRTSTIVIGMIPSGMFLLTSLALSVGIIKLARYNTLVQDLYSLESLARVDTICFDKTGTITDGRMSVKDVVPLTDKIEQPINAIMGSMLGTLKDNNQTAIALYNYFGHNNDYHAIKSLPFNSIRKLSAVTFDDIGTYAFGAPEFVLSDIAYEKVKKHIYEYTKLGLRVLLLGHSKSEIIDDTIPNNFSPIALILVTDNIREDAIDTIKWFKENEVAVKVISGDDPVTVSEVSKRAGIPNADRYISLEGLTNNEVFEAANIFTVFGRVSPEQKAILIKGLKTAGHTTAMVGDGINDILALKESDCAITVASGSDSARNLSNIVLLDNNFSSMPKVVMEGRRVINNVQSSSSLYLMKTIFTMLLAFVTLCLPYMKTYPFKLSQMNLLEIFVIGIPSFFLSLQPNTERVKGKFISQVMSKSLPNGILMFFSAALIEIFRFLINNQFPIDVYTTMAVYAITFTGLISLYNICKPFNLYRAILFSITFLTTLLITIFSIDKGFALLSLTKMTPMSIYWHHILVIVTVLFISTSALSTIENICSKIKFKEPHTKKDLTDITKNF